MEKKIKATKRKVKTATKKNTFRIYVKIYNEMELDSCERHMNRVSRMIEQQGGEVLGIEVCSTVLETSSGENVICNTFVLKYSGIDELKW